jgi:hypothetical protein
LDVFCRNNAIDLDYNVGVIIFGHDFLDSCGILARIEAHGHFGGGHKDDVVVVLLLLVDQLGHFFPHVGTDEHVDAVVSMGDGELFHFQEEFGDADVAEVTDALPFHQSHV